MTREKRLDTVLDVLKTKVLKDILKPLGVPVPTTKAERITLLRRRLIAGAVQLEWVLDRAYVEELREMCDAAGKRRDGVRDKLESRLLRWFKKTFRSDEELPPELDFTTAEYAEQFRAELAPAAEPLAPRPYQAKAIDELLTKLGAPSAKPQLLHVATGGGKTFIANDVVRHWRRRSEGPVLWVTKDWQLLFQAARDVSRRGGGRLSLARLGGEGRCLHPLPEWRRGSQYDVVYTTLHTLNVQWDEVRTRLKPSLIVWDECHWAEHTTLGSNVVRWHTRGRVPLLGLTATPRDGTRFELAYTKTFSELVANGWLAEPMIAPPVKTGIDWAPHVKAGDFDAASLELLATSKERNKLIVDYVADNARKLGKAMVFACNIVHADLLAKMLTDRRGIAARPIHSAMPIAQRHAALQAFIAGNVQVLVNVAMLTHGIDVPETRSILLCRPTTSDILFSQMVGRAARRHEPSGKTSFSIVEFTDNVKNHGDLLVEPKRFFQGSAGDGGAARDAERAETTAPKPTLQFDPHGAPALIPDSPALPEAVRGLWYRNGQSFGIELELTRDGFDELPGDEWMAIADELRWHLEQALPGRVAPRPIQQYSTETAPDAWSIKWDGTCGWEITSPILVNQAGYEEAARACDAITRAAVETGLRVNHETGLHIHLGWLGDTDQVRRALLLARVFEPAVATLVAPSRLVAFDGAGYDIHAPNAYCKPVAAVFRAEDLDRARTLEDLFALAPSRCERYVTFNIRPMESIQTVEVRLHNGTTEAAKVLLWLSLWQQLLWAAAHAHDIAPVPDRDVIAPEGDILALAKRYLPHEQPSPKLWQRLHARRCEVRELWKRRPELQAWVDLAERWDAALVPVGEG